jgi:drug/metabolite transporter (DMT)-like permease
MRSRATDRLWVFAAALLFSTGGAAIKGNSFNAWQVACFRSLVAAVAVALFIPESRRAWKPRHVLVGFAYAAMLITFVTATKLTTAANAIFLQSTAPAYVLFLSPLLLNEKLRRSDLFLLAGVGIGMALFFVASEPARVTAPDPVTGNIVALVSGVFWALTIVGLRWVGRREDGAHASIATTVLGNLLAFGLAAPFAFPVTRVEPADIAVLLYLGVFQIGLAYVCLGRAMQRVSAFEAVTLLLVEPALNPLWTWIILRERPSALSIAGGAIILTSTIVNALWQSRVPDSITTAHPSGEA